MDAILISFKFNKESSESFFETLDDNSTINDSIGTFCRDDSNFISHNINSLPEEQEVNEKFNMNDTMSLGNANSCCIYETTPGKANVSKF